MKKVTGMMISVCMCMCLTACAGSAASSQTEKANESAAQSEGKIRVIAATFPEYDWARNMIGDHTDTVELSLLINNGVDVHSYQPTAADVITISDCDMFIYGGGESEQWVQDALDKAENKDMTVLNMMDTIGAYAKIEEVVEGMQDEPCEDDGEAEEYDEHVWLSLRNAKIICDQMADDLAALDAANAEDYKANAKAYGEKLETLDQQYQAAADAADQKVLIFGDRFPFRYLLDDYGIDYYAAFKGCSAETEASFETITFLAKKMDELGIQHMITIEKSDQKIAKTVIQNTTEKNQDILTMDSMQSVNKEDIEAGETYLSVMEKNLETIKKAFNE